MAVPSKEYWAQRALKRETESMQACAELTDKLFREYEAAARVIRKDIADFYTRYGQKHGLSYEESIQTLSRAEMREWKATLSEYVAKIAAETDPEVKKKLTAQLDALSMNSRITRLEALEGQIDLTLNDLFDTGVAQMKEEFGDIFTEGYYKKCYDIQSRRGFFNEIAKISPEEVEHVLSYPWSGAMFSDRLWQNKQALIYNVREILTQGVIQGKSIDAMTQALAGKMGQSYKAAERLIRTETNYIHNESSKAAYIAASVEKYEFMASLNERTCEICGELDGKVFPVKDAVAGTNYPPIHPNCRCTTVEYDPEDIADRIASGEPMPKNMSYTEWKKKQDASHGEGYIDKERKKSYNEKADRKLYNAYVNRLGTYAPKTFDEFQTVKYFTPDAWKKMHSFYSYKGRVPEATKADFDIYEIIKDSGIYGTIRVPPAPIDSSTLTLDIGHITDRNHNVTLEEAQSFIDNAIFSLERRHWTGETYVNYYSKSGAAYVKTSEPVIRTAFGKDEFDERIKKIMEEIESGEENNTLPALPEAN